MRYLCFLFLILALPAQAQQAGLTVQHIMQDPATWIGASPGTPWWSDGGTTLYFNWNPMGQFESDSLFKITMDDTEPTQVSPQERRTLPPRFTGWQHGTHVYDAAFETRVFERGGDLFLYEIDADNLVRLTQTRARERNPRFAPTGRAIIYEQGGNLYKRDLENSSLVELTDLRRGAGPGEDKDTPHEAFLEEQQLALFAYIREEAREDSLRDAMNEKEAEAADRPPTYYLGKKQLQQLQIDPTERFVTFVLSQPGDPSTRTEVQDYVTESGYAEILNARQKVGRSTSSSELYIQDLERDTTYKVDLYQLEGAYDVPQYIVDQGIERDSSEAKRDLIVTNLSWSGDGAYGVVEIRAADNKTRWLARIHPEANTLDLLDRQDDEAWVAGPEIGWTGWGGTLGWLADNRRLYFQSEESGYSHLYVVDVETGEKQRVTEGDFEVFDPMLSKDGTAWFFTSSEGSPFERHFYAMSVWGGPRTKLTTMKGNNQVALSPDEQSMALRYSFSNKPPEVYVGQLGGTGNGAVRQVTASTTEAWQAYDWRAPEIIRFEASDGKQVPARIYTPSTSNGAAVLFVHGAGYLQNVHHWWSGYFREYMFHNLLADQGYTVLDVDFRASAGYGRDWRTAIYRHMGGRDLQDYVDASRYVTEEFGIDPERVFIYGGSYGGFITLMALFTEPEHFGGGAALRSVTDWAHYNHPYTSNILNTPAADSVAYARSSPINFAEGLEDPLLIAHGMVDTNVQFQDVVRLAQRLIELGKEDWEMAVYPIEGHGFTEPSSWTDEYSRILKLIEQSVGPGRE